jgi:predicted nuclease of restriction endonuclease-like (RecB) superfamily
MLYERTALSRKPGELIEQELSALRDAQRMSPALLMRDPYILDFLGLQDTVQEGDVEAAIIREMESFLLELGSGFSFVARQKRIQIDRRALCWGNACTRRPSGRITESRAPDRLYS